VDLCRSQTVVEHILCIIMIDLVYHDLLLNLTCEPPYGPWDTTPDAQICVMLQAVGTATLKGYSAMLH
jgi:hypothetical protein